MSRASALGLRGFLIPRHRSAPTTIPNRCDPLGLGLAVRCSMVRSVRRRNSVRRHALRVECPAPAVHQTLRSFGRRLLKSTAGLSPAQPFLPGNLLSRSVFAFRRGPQFRHSLLDADSPNDVGGAGTAAHCVAAMQDGWNRGSNCPHVLGKADSKGRPIMGRAVEAVRGRFTSLPPRPARANPT